MRAGDRCIPALGVVFKINKMVFLQCFVRTIFYVYYNVTQKKQKLPVRDIEITDTDELIEAFHGEDGAIGKELFEETVHVYRQLKWRHNLFFNDFSRTNLQCNPLAHDAVLLRQHLYRDSLLL